MDSVSISLQPLFRSDPFVLSGRIMDLYTHIDTCEKEAEVEYNSESPVCGNALSSSVQSEH